MFNKNYILYLTALALIVAMPAFAQTEIVCIGAKAMYAANGLPGSIFEYKLEQEDAGEIILIHKDSIVVEWGGVKGVYQLGVREISQYGCYGNWAFLNVEIVGEYAQFGQTVYSVCTDEGVTVDFNKADFQAYNWVGENVSPEGYISKPGIYELVTIDHNNCRLSSFVEVVEIPTPIISLGRDTMMCEPNFTLYALNTQNNHPETVYTWSTGESGQFLTRIDVKDHNIDESSQFWVRAEYDGCVTTDTLTVLRCKLIPDIPNTFTPNGDGENDLWNIPDLIEYPDCIMEVFDRWGRRVFLSPRGYPVPWDGRDANGNYLPMEAYYYILHLNDGKRAEPVLGTITLIR